MTSKETELFVQCLSKIAAGSDLDVASVSGAYRHLSCDDAIHAFLQDFFHYEQGKENLKLHIFGNIERENKGGSILYDAVQTSKYLS